MGKLRWRNRLKCDGEIGCFYSSANKDAEAQGSLGHFLERFKGVSTRRLHSCLMWFRWLREAARVGDRTSLMREQLDDGRYEKIRKKMMEPEYEFHLEPDVQTAG